MLNKSGAKLPAGCKAKSFTLKVIDDLFKDCIFDISDLPEDMKEVYLEWLHSLPLYLQRKVQSLVKSDMIRYNDLNRENLILYAHYDIVYTLEIWASLAHIIKNRHQEEAIKIENKCILPWYDMECTGFHADVEYLENCRKKMKAYILKLREEFYELEASITGALAAPPLSISQGCYAVSPMREPSQRRTPPMPNSLLSPATPKFPEFQPMQSKKPPSPTFWRKPFTKPATNWNSGPTGSGSLPKHCLRYKNSK